MVGATSEARGKLKYPALVIGMLPLQRGVYEKCILAEGRYGFNHCRRKGTGLSVDPVTASANAMTPKRALSVKTLLGTSVCDPRQM